MVEKDPGSQVTTRQSSGYVHILQEEELCLGEGELPARGHTGNLVAKKPPSEFPILLSAGLLEGPSTPSLPLGQVVACLFAYSLGYVAMISSQLGVGSMRSGAEEGHGGR